MNLSEMESLLKEDLSQSRFEHSINVMNCAKELAKLWNCDLKKAAIAGLLHDCARNPNKYEIFDLCRQFDIKPDEVETEQSVLLHGSVGAKIDKTKYKVDDEEILQAIECHTTGRMKMSLLDKIIFLADFIEPKRCFRGVEKARKLSRSDIDEAVLYCMDSSVKNLISNNRIIHKNTIDARNYMIDYIKKFKK